jgi:TRAP-type C4-dicarboxylate transport system substrate-binding protein
VSYRFYEAAKFVTVGGSYSTLAVFTPIIISKTAWEGLNEGERQALEEAATLANLFFDAGQREAQETAVETFTKAGVNVQPLSFEEYAAWLELAKTTAWKSYREVSPRASDLLDSLLRSFINSGPRQ